MASLLRITFVVKTKSRTSGLKPVALDLVILLIFLPTRLQLSVLHILPNNFVCQLVVFLTMGDNLLKLLHLNNLFVGVPPANNLNIYIYLICLFLHFQLENKT